MPWCKCCLLFGQNVCPFRKATDPVDTTDGDVDRKVRPVDLLAPGTWPDRRTQMTGVMGRLSARVFLAMALGTCPAANDNEPPGGPPPLRDPD